VRTGRLARWKNVWIAFVVCSSALSPSNVAAQGQAAQTQSPPGGAPSAPGGQSGPGGPGAAGQEERYTNLQVLPKDIKRPQLTEIMQSFTRSLGVKCDHCHMGDSPQSMDWADDDKDEKKNARDMMKLVRSINEAVSGLTKAEAPREQVTCVTCHRGLAKPPRPLGDILAEKAIGGGPDAAIAEYNRLHVEAGDAGQYDFREGALNAAARKLSDEKRLPDAIALLRKNAELFPKSSEVAAMLGTALLESGDTEGARAELQRALDLDPDNRFARGALERLKAKPAAP
jgi:hypothetical protein